MATGIQRGKTEEIAERHDALSLCQTTGREISYINPRTLKPNATETGETSPNISRRKKTLTEQSVEERLEALIETNTVKLRMRSEMAKLHDGTVVSLTEAAMFLDVSTSTLKTLRLDGSGLKCIKYKSKTHNAQNHLVHFTLGELRRFIEENIE